MEKDKRIPNKETIKAMEDVEKGIVKSFESIEKLFKDLEE